MTQPRRDRAETRLVGARVLVAARRVEIRVEGGVKDKVKVWLKFG